ncbi:MAG: hypothetical protein J4F28_09260 [Nitrosopumilaceae archaeon]|nr:hypothetical protein [Nitrosopumilaceae archaeon]
MNRQGAASVRAIKRALPFEPPGELLLFIIFGSQIRNTEAPESDLDILYVTRTESKQFNEAVHDTLAGTRGGVKRATIFAHTPQTIKKYTNLYGTVEYGALRGHHDGGSVILYRADNACDELDGALPAGVGGCPGDGVDGHNKPDAEDTVLWARRWLIISEKSIADGLSYAKEHASDGDSGRHAWVVRDAMYRSIECAIKACLLHHGVKFPFMRDIRALHAMLPPESRMPLDPGLDLGVLWRWDGRPDRRSRRTAGRHTSHYDCTRSDADAATGAAQATYALVSEMVPPHPEADALQSGAASPLPIIFTMPTARGGAAPA